MNTPDLTLSRTARIAAGLAGLSGAAGFLRLMGAFGPVSCWTSVSAGGTATSAGGPASTETTVARGCEAGIDYLLGGGGGNAGVFFFWAVVLLVLVTVGGVAAWTGHRYVTSMAAGVGVVVSILGLWSIGWYFMLPTVFLIAAAIALTVDARRDSDGTQATKA